MPTCIALLRGINVGGHHRVPMADLRALFERLGHTNVATYIQSGNVLFDSDRDEVDLTTELSDAIQQRFGFEVPVVVRTATDLAALPASHPLAHVQPEEKLQHVVFLGAAPSAESIAAFDGARYAPDQLVVEAREAFIAYPNGSARSKLTLDAVVSALGANGTARNWLTVNRLRALCDER
jgi:uncharacterized protein (DUF1697 family)